MPIDYSIADQVGALSFGRFKNPKVKLDFVKQGTLSNHFNDLFAQASVVRPALSYEYWPLLATAGVEMWHRALHSFLWSLASTKSSPIWSSVSGYYASHFVMRGFAHSMGIFNSFRRSTGIQVVLQDKNWVCQKIPGGREHTFYWKVVKDHPLLSKNPIFRENHEREDRPVDVSDAIHRNFANYTDHIALFNVPNFLSSGEISERVQQISRINRYQSNAPAPQRNKFPDITIIQILAFQRIVTLRDFFDLKYTDNRFWKAHRDPAWCRNVMEYEIAQDGLMDGVSDQLKPENILE